MASVFMVTGVLSVAATPSAVAATPLIGQTLNVALPVDAGTLDPRLAQDTSAEAVDSLIFDPLIRLNNNLGYVPTLATSWKQVNPTTWDFFLRKGVTFSNGQPFTAADVVYTFTTILDPSFHAPYISLYTPIKSVTALNDYEVQFTLSAPYAPFLSYMTMGIVPHLTAGNADFATHPIGTGPYVLKSWQRNSEISLSRNSTFWGARPYAQYINFFVMPDTTSQVNALTSGTLNLITSPLPPQDVITLEHNPSVVVRKETGLGVVYFNINQKDPIMKDLAVREALNDLTNRQAITQKITDGIDSPAATMLMPGTWAYTRSIAIPKFSVAAAEKVLNADGWHKNSKGVMTKNGKTLTITLSTYNDPEREQILTYEQGVLAQAGIQAKISIQDWATFIAGVMAHKYQVALMGWLGLTDPDRGMYGQFVTGQGNNWEQFSNPQVDKLLTEARQTVGNAQRKALYVQASQIILKDLPYIVISDQGWVVITGKNVQGATLNRTGSFYFLTQVWLSN